MLSSDARMPMLKSAMGATAPNGHLLIAEGPKGMAPVRELVARSGWLGVKTKPNRLIARRNAG